MATGTVSPFVRLQFCDDNGDPLTGAQLFIYDAGTTTKATTYTDVNLTVPNTNPIILDSAGRCVIFLDAGSFKYVMAPSTDTDPPTSPYWTVDGVGSVPAASVDNDITGTAGEDLLAGDAVYLSDGSGGGTVGRWYKGASGDAYSSSAAGAVGLAPAAISSGASGSIRLSGRLTGLSGLTAGSVYYISATPGVITLTPPANARQVGMAESTTVLVITQGIPSATATVPGLVSVGAQDIPGVKEFQEPPTFVAGGVAAGGTAVSTVGGVINAQSGAGIPTVGVTETTLFTYTLPGNTLSTNKVLRISFLVSFAANANTKKLRLYYGSTAATIVDAAVNVSVAQGVGFGWILCTGVGSQQIQGSVAVTVPGGGGDVYADSQASSEDETTDLAVKLTGEGTSNGDVTGYGFVVEVVG